MTFIVNPLKKVEPMIYAQHFTQEEFREWSDDISPRLVTMLDVLRFRISQKPKAG
jgi:hypothetical protein